MKLLLLSLFITIFMSCKKEDVEPSDDEQNLIESVDFVGCWVSTGSYTLCFNEDYDLTYKEINLLAGSGSVINDTLFYGDSQDVHQYWFVTVGETIEYNYVGGLDDNIVYTRE